MVVTGKMQFAAAVMSLLNKEFYSFTVNSSVTLIINEGILAVCVVMPVRIKSNKFQYATYKSRSS